MLNTVFESAKRAKKQDWQTYELYKTQINSIPLQPDEYTGAIKKLTEILEI